mmetsp:Transcript_5902/g.16876  ORF Transcript_5902/g.16876 Transcript_5902/m.16876 type:complete len:217 (+) Transcript_5902:912-1562(+)
MPDLVVRGVPREGSVDQDRQDASGLEVLAEDEVREAAGGRLRGPQAVPTLETTWQAFVQQVPRDPRARGVGARALHHLGHPRRGVAPLLRERRGRGLRHGRPGQRLLGRAGAHPVGEELRSTQVDHGGDGFQAFELLAAPNVGLLLPQHDALDAAERLLHIHEVDRAGAQQLPLWPARTALTMGGRDPAHVDLVAPQGAVGGTPRPPCLFGRGPLR